MADVRKMSLNWNEIDHSIISAISAMQIARDYFNTNSTVIAGRQPGRVISPVPALAKPVTCWHVIRDEQVSSCFDDAERMLDEVRMRMMIARAILSGGPQIETAAGPWLPVTAAATPPQHRPSLRVLLSRRAVAITTVAMKAGRNAKAVAKAALEVVSRKWAARRRIFVTRYAFVQAAALIRKLDRHLSVPALRNIPVGMRRGLLRWSHLLQNAGVYFGTRPASAIAARPLHARSWTLIYTGGAILAGAALTIWVASTTTVGSPATAQPPMVANDAASTPAVYSSCSIAAWGKACYPRRSRL